jgi:hypothetical protein
LIYTSTEYNRHTGLGNKLFPWSRAKIFSHEYGAVMLHTNWISIRGASVIRGGIDYSKVFGKIFLFDNFINDKNEINNYLCSMRHQIFNDKIYVSNLIEASKYLTYDRKLIIFKWNEDHFFSELFFYRNFIKQQLINITNPKLRHCQIENMPFIGLNIRMGNDFIEASSIKVGYKKTRIEWFLDNISTIRKIHGFLPVYVVSDGPYGLLFKLFSNIKDVHIVNNGTAIQDLLFLIKARVFMGSGNSSFSAWISFLGDMPTYCSNETSFSQFKLNNVKVI